MKIALIDFETLDNKPSAVVLSAALDFFNPFEQDSYQDILNRLHLFKFNVAHQQALQIPRTISLETVEWWKEQSSEAKEVLRPLATDIRLDEFIEQLNDLFDKEKPDIISSRRINFDLSILADIYDSYGYDSRYKPIEFWRTLDIPSFLAGLMIDPKFNKVKHDPEGFLAHVAAHDVAKEVFNLQNLIKELR
jgi:hypothetical protein